MQTQSTYIIHNSLTWSTSYSHYRASMFHFTGMIKTHTMYGTGYTLLYESYAFNRMFY